MNVNINDPAAVVEWKIWVAYSKADGAEVRECACGQEFIGEDDDEECPFCE